MTDTQHLTATARDGTAIAYRLLHGRGRARFVLVHSLATNGAFWDRVAAPLLDAGDILLVDCRGHGASGKPAGPYTVELFADDLADVMAVTGWSKAVVAGASMGGCVALAFAAAYPERLAGLGLIDTTAWYGDAAPAQWEERAEKALEGGMQALVGFQKSRWVSEAFLAAHPEVVDAAVAVFLKNDVRAYVETCRMLGRADKRAALAHIKAPTAILVGSEDYATPVAMAEAMHSAIPGASLDVIPGVRHFTPLECPEVIAKILAEIARRADQ
jgi:3-oxoadipate enol-lactonase